MANNRMFLVHVPTGLAASLGKRMAWGWYMHDWLQNDMGKMVARLYEVLENEFNYNGEQDNFAVALENAEGAILATERWVYGPPREDGLTQLVMEEKAT